MRKIIFTLVFVMLMAVSAYGDEYYKFVKITCAEEVGFMEIQAIGIYNIRDFVWTSDLSKFNSTNLEKLKKQYGLYYGSHLKGKIANHCMFNKRKIKTEIEYNRPKERGQCSANPSAILNIWIDNVELIRNATFHEDCFNMPSIYKVSLEFINGELFLNMCVNRGDGESYNCGVIMGTDLNEKEPITMEYIIKKILKEY